jgi:hypothetical protein
VHNLGAMKSFTTARDFNTPELSVIPGQVLSEQEIADQEFAEQMEYEDASRFGDF